jgi:glycosyltransferase involved in cell wall biosynthesis
VRRAAAVIAVSEHARQELQRVLRVPAGKIHVVHEAAPNGFQPLVSPAARAALRRKYQLPDEYLLYVGTLEPRKNLNRLIRALKQVRAAGHRHRLVLVGPQGWMMQNFRKEIAAEDMTNAVQFLGYVPTADLPGLYSLATLFVFPSLYEGFGLPPLEAMACGTPVVSSNRSSLAEICGDAAHLVDPEDTPQIAQALCDLLEDPARRAALGQRGLARAKSFSWQRAAQETAAIYRQVVAAS